MTKETIRPESPSFKARLRGGATQVVSFLAGIKDGVLRKRLQSPAPTPEALPRWEVDRAEARVLINEGVCDGLVSDASVQTLYQSYWDQGVALRGELGAAQARYEASLRRLSAMFPELPAPTPEPLAPPPPKTYPRMRNLFGGNGKANPLH
jgi:hypothetical protein